MEVLFYVVIVLLSIIILAGAGYLFHYYLRSKSQNQDNS